MEGYCPKCGEKLHYSNDPKYFYYSICPSCDGHNEKETVEQIGDYHE